MLEVKKFGAKWCGPCRALQPVLDGLKEEHLDVVFESYDVDAAHEEAAQFAVRSLPTVVFIKDGIEVDRLIGLSAKLAYQNKINEHKG